MEIEDKKEIGIKIIVNLILWIPIIIILWLFGIIIANADTPGYIELYDDHVTPAERILRVEDTDYAEWQISSLSDTTRANRLIAGWRKNVAANKRVYFSFSGTIRYALSQDVSYRELHVYTYDGTNLVEVNANCIDNGTRVNYSGYAYADFKENFSCSFKTTTAINRVHVRWNYYHSDGTNADIQLLHFMQTSNTFSDSENDADSINANNDKNTNAIMENNDQNTYEIIQNNQQNTEDIINALKKENQTCVSNFDYKYTLGILTTNGGISTNTNAIYTSEYIQIDSSTTIKIIDRKTTGSYLRLCFYTEKDVNTYISCVVTNEMNLYSEISIPNNANFIRVSINNNDELPSLMICKNSSLVTDEKIDNISNWLNNDSVTINGNDVPTASFSFPISNLFTMPITLAQSFNGTCSAYNVPFRGQNITFPCLHLENYLGSNLWNIIDLMFVFGMVISIASLFRKVYVDFASLNDDVFNEYYTPQHAGYKPKHGGGS